MVLFGKCFELLSEFFVHAACHECSSVPIVAFVSDRSVIEIYLVVVCPCVVGNI